MLMFLPIVFALAANEPAPAASSAPATSTAPATGGARPTPLTEIGRVRALPACVPIVAHANGAITQALDNDRTLAIISANLHNTDYDKLNVLQRRNAVEALMKQAEAMRVDDELGQRRDIAHAEIPALPGDRMDDMRGIADQREALRRVALGLDQGEWIGPAARLGLTGQVTRGGGGGPDREPVPGPARPAAEPARPQAPEVEHAGLPVVVQLDPQGPRARRNFHFHVVPRRGHLVVHRPAPGPSRLPAHALILSRDRPAPAVLRSPLRSRPVQILPVTAPLPARSDSDPSPHHPPPNQTLYGRGCRRTGRWGPHDRSAA